MSRVLDPVLRNLREMVLRMGSRAEAILHKSLRAVWERVVELAAQVPDDDLAIDRLDVEIDDAVLKALALQQPDENASSRSDLEVGAGAVRAVHEGVRQLGDEVDRLRLVPVGRPFGVGEAELPTAGTAAKARGLPLQVEARTGDARLRDGNHLHSANSKTSRSMDWSSPSRTTIRVRRERPLRAAVSRAA